MAHDRSDVDDGPRAALPHVRHDGLHHADCAIEIRFETGANLIERNIFHSAGKANTCVVHQHVDAGSVLLRGSHSLANGLVLIDVQSYGDDIRMRLDSRGVSRPSEDAVALACEVESCFPSDSRACSSYDGGWHARTIAQCSASVLK